MKTKNIFSRFAFCLVCCSIVAVLTSCDDFLDITPTGKVIATTGEEYRALLTNEYKYFPKDRHMTTVRTDELQLSGNTSSNDLDAYLDLWLWKDDNPSPTTSYFSWRTYYHNIYYRMYKWSFRPLVITAVIFLYQFCKIILAACNSYFCIIRSHLYILSP